MLHKRAKFIEFVDLDSKIWRVKSDAIIAYTILESHFDQHKNYISELEIHLSNGVSFRVCLNCGEIDKKLGVDKC